MVVLGIGEIVTSYFFGKLIDKLRKIVLININNAMSWMAIIFSFLSLKLNSYFCCLVAGFFWGGGDVASLTLISSLIASDFDGKLEGFTMFRFLMCVGVVLGSVISIVFKDASIYYSILSVAMLMFIVLIGSNFYKERTKEERQKERE